MPELPGFLLEITISDASKAVGTIGLVIIAVGLWFRRRPRLHIPMMVTAFVVDVANVLVIELNRSAIKQALEGGELLLNFHVSVSVICVVCYVVALITGPILLKRGRCRTAHKWNAVVFIVTRLLNFVTSWWM